MQTSYTSRFCTKLLYKERLKAAVLRDWDAPNGKQCEQSCVKNTVG